MKGFFENRLYFDERRVVATGNRGRILLCEEKKPKKRIILLTTVSYQCKGKSL